MSDSPRNSNVSRAALGSGRGQGAVHVAPVFIGKVKDSVFNYS